MKVKELIREKAEKYYAGGYNCCQGVLLAADDVYLLQISKDVIDSARFFREGMGSGCTCGALIGMEMSLGIIRQRHNLAMDLRLARQLHDRFVAVFGSSCCRVLRKQQGFVAKTTQRGCKKITAGAAVILYELLADQGIVKPLKNE